MSWNKPIVSLLVTDECRAKALVRYELAQFECRFRRGRPFFVFFNSLDEGPAVEPDQNLIKQALTPGDDTSLLAWLDKMFQAFVVSCPLGERGGGDGGSEERRTLDSATKINQLFKALSEAQKAPTSYHKKG